MSKSKVGFEKVKPRADREELREKFYRGVEQSEWSLIETIRQFRIMLGLNQKEFAEFAGLTHRAVMEFEQGRRNPTLQTLEKMLKGSGLEIGVKRKRPPKGIVSRRS